MRLEMIIDRAIGAAAQQAAARAEMQTLIDSATGLLNRHALDRDLRREVARAVRYKRPLCVVVLCVADEDGVQTFASALRDGVRAGDLAYRMGGDELAAILGESDPSVGDTVIGRLEAGGAAEFTYGMAAYPGDGDDPHTLLDVAQQRARS